VLVERVRLGDVVPQVGRQLVVVGVGLVYLFLGNPHDRSDAPHGDAVTNGAHR